MSILLSAFWLKETLPKEKRGTGENKASFSFRSLFSAVKHPTVGFLLVLMFFQQIAFGGFEQFLSLFTLSRLGLNAVGNTIVFVYVGAILIVVQGGLIGRWSRRFGDRRLVLGALVALSLGLIIIGITPKQTVPWYSQAALVEELSVDDGTEFGEVQTIEDIEVELPEDGNSGYLGLLWFLVAMIPIAVGGGVLRPGINSLITKRVGLLEVGGILGISAAFSSMANAASPVIGGVMFEYVGYTAPFVVSGVLIGVLFFFAVRRIQPEASDMEKRSAAGHGH
jgi:MFS family permease